MAASYPGSIKSFTTKVNNVDTVDASHINDLQDEVVAIETALGASLANIFSKRKIISLTRVMDAASGNVAYTGVGFTPKFLAALGFQSSSGVAGRSYFGFAESGGTEMGMGSNDGDVKTGSTSKFIYAPVQSDSDRQEADVNSWDADGFTLAWTKQGAPSSVTCTFLIACLG